MPDIHDLVGQIQLEIARALGGVEPLRVDALRRAIREAPRVFVAGRGRSGLQIQAFAMRLMHLGLRAHVVGDATTPAIQRGDLLLIGSASGRTASLVGYADQATRSGARVALITSAEQSPILERAALWVRIPTPGAGTVQPLGSPFEAALGLLLDAIVIQLMQELGVAEQQMRARHANLE